MFKESLSSFIYLRLSMPPQLCQIGGSIFLVILGVWAVYHEVVRSSLGFGITTFVFHLFWLGITLVKNLRCTEHVTEYNVALSLWTIRLLGWTPNFLMLEHVNHSHFFYLIFASCVEPYAVLALFIKLGQGLLLPKKKFASCEKHTGTVHHKNNETCEPSNP